MAGRDPEEHLQRADQLGRGHKVMGGSDLHQFKNRRKSGQTLPQIVQSIGF